MASKKKETLLDIGERLISRRGYRDVCVKDIAEAAGLGAASFYTYFPGKEAFYEAIVERLEKREIAAVEKRVESFRSPLNKLRALFRSVVKALRGNPVLAGIYSGEKRFMYPGSEERMKREDALLGRIEEMMRRILSEGARKGIFRSDVFRHPERMLMTVFRSLISARGPGDAEDLIQDASMLVERGMKRWIRLRMRDERLDRRASRIP